jgi:hypothetical protein
MALARLFARFAHVPTMVLGLNGLAIMLVARGHSYAWIGLLIGVAVLLSLLAERVVPYEEAWNRSHADVGKDAAHGVLYELNNLIALLLLPVITLFTPGAASGRRPCRSARSSCGRSWSPMSA